MIKGQFHDKDNQICPNLLKLIYISQDTPCDFDKLQYCIIEHGIEFPTYQHKKFNKGSVHVNIQYYGYQLLILLDVIIGLDCFVHPLARGFIS